MNETTRRRRLYYKPSTLVEMSVTIKQYFAADIMATFITTVQKTDIFIDNLTLTYQLQICNIKKMEDNREWKTERNLEVTGIYLRILCQYFYEDSDEDHNLFLIPKIIIC